MASHRLTDQQITEIVQEVISNARQRQETYLPRAAPLNPRLREALQSFFPPGILEEVRMLELKDEHLPNPAYQKRAQLRGYRVMLDFRHIPEIIHPQLVIFQEKPPLRLLFHAMVHVMQYAVLGLERYLDLYVRAFIQIGNYAAVPLEVQAFELDRRYTEHPARSFSVEAEVREWAGTGRYVIRAAMESAEQATPPH